MGSANTSEQYLFTKSPVFAMMRLMEKRVENIFDYNNYKLLLGADFSQRSALNPSYSLRSYSRDLDISLSYLSEIINGKKDISEVKGRHIFSNMGYKEDELDFIESMITINTSKDVVTLQEAREVYYHYRSYTGYIFNSKKDEIINSVEHFLVFCMARIYTDLEDICTVTRMFSVSDKQVIDVLDDFISKKYITKKGNQYIVDDPNRMISDHENYCKFLTQFSSFFFNHYCEQNKSSLPDNVASGLVLSLDDSTLKEVHDLNAYYIMTLLKISKRVKDPKYFGFVSNLYLEKEIFSKNQ